ncbi:trypsin-like [Haliotis rufescens]|uniref:trypsin-like n=1 Tax=Haliotis rufescens TaxID=6454 RepID=UPI00201F97A1|nr:trypsin-like [Haliotis rufescens]
MPALLCFVLGYLASGVLSEIEPPGCGINDVGFDYTTLPKTARKRIVGGQIATPHSFPWMAALENLGVMHCAGSLLKGNSDRWYILTSAHCLHGTMASDWKIRLGAHDLSQSETSSEFLDAKTAMTHPLFNPTTYEYDIGLIELSSAPLVSKPEINFGCVSGNVSTAGEVCYVAGWGTTSFGGAVSDELRVVEKPVLSRTECRNIYGSNQYHEASMICAGHPDGGKGSCTRDSGGPLMCFQNDRMEIIGIVSWGPGCAQPNSPAVYASSSGGRQWIEATINE